MDISKKYRIELNKINNHLTDLEKGKVYELTKAPGTPTCSTLAEHLREDIGILLTKIENNDPSISEKIARISDRT